MNKISIVGSPGSGKSTLARELATITKLPLYHLDRMMWKPNWVMVDRDTQIALQKEVVSQTEWIIDGNYNATMGIRFQRSDVIVFLDFDRITCIYHVFKRYLKYRSKTRPDMIEGNQERLELDFLQYIWNFPKRNRPVIINQLNTFNDSKTIYYLHTKKEVKNFLNQMRREYDYESMDSK